MEEVKEVESKEFTGNSVMSIKNLSVNFKVAEGTVNALDRVSLDLAYGETIGIVGESGSGKSTFANAMIALLPENAVISGDIVFEGERLPYLSNVGRKEKKRDVKILDAKLRAIRWKEISMIFQGAMNSFNPAYTIGKQLKQVFQIHTDFDLDQINKKMKEVVIKAGLNPSVLASYPHELSGGMKQRAVIALALALNPKMVIADEPTTGLDVVVQAKLISTLKKLRASGDLKSLVIISHDLGVVSQLADRVAVLYAGRLMEIGSVMDIYLNSRNPYTLALLENYPSMRKARERVLGIPGTPPDLLNPPKGCRFAERCKFADSICTQVDPPVVQISPGHFSACHFADKVNVKTAEKKYSATNDILSSHSSGGLPLIKTVDLTKFFGLRSSAAGSIFVQAGKKSVAHAVEKLNIEIKEGEIYAIVGESGSGKTTVGRLLLKSIEPTAGKLFFNIGEDKVLELSNKTLSNEKIREFRSMSQLIMQDPYDSLNPKMSVFDTVAEPIEALKLEKDPSRIEAMVSQSLESAGLSPASNYIFRFPHELSGGERQRVGVARALSVPSVKFLLADEPISMMDISLRAHFLNNILELRQNRKLSIVYITHDMASARYVSDRMLIMYLGMPVEEGETESVITNPLHPYTKALIQAVPEPNPTWKPERTGIIGEIGSIVNVPKGCRFYDRCIFRKDICKDEAPPKREESGHWYLCHFSQSELIVNSPEEMERDVTGIKTPQGSSINVSGR